MNSQELATKISQLKGVKPVPNLPGTFMNPVPFTNENIIHFVRAVADDFVLKASSINADNEHAISNAARILDFAQANLHKLQGKLVTRIEPYDSGDPKFDTFLALAPSIAEVVIGGSALLKSRTTVCYAINHIEFSGEETEAEAVVRDKHVRLSDVTREITPIIFGRYHKQTGQRTAEHLAVVKHDRAAEFIREMPRDGGVVEFENWERVRMTLTTDKGSETLEATFNGETKPLSVDDAVKLLEELSLRGSEAAKKAW